MSTALELISELRDRGAEVWAEGDRVLISPARALDPDLRERIRAAKPAVLELLRAAPPEMQLGRARPRTAPLSDRGRAALGGEASAPTQPTAEYATPSSAQERKGLLDRFLRDERVPFATFDSRAGAFLMVRDRRALQALDQEHAALPVLYIAELESWADELGVAGLRALLAAREVEGPGVELRRVTRTHVDG